MELFGCSPESVWPEGKAAKAPTMTLEIDRHLDYLPVPPRRASNVPARELL